MKAKDLLEELSRWGNYGTSHNDDFNSQFVNEELNLFGTLKLRSVDRKSHIEVIEVRRGKRVAGVFVPGNVHIENFKKSDKLWQVKALLLVLSQQDHTTTLTEVVRCLYEDKVGKKYINDIVAKFKADNELRKLSRVIAARMMMNC